MKTILLIILVTLSLASFSKTPTPGSGVSHKLSCKNSEDLGTAKIGLIVLTKAVNPIASVREITVTIKSNPKAKVEEIKLNQKSQNAYNAEFSVDFFKVMLDKSAMRATLYFGSSVLDCK